MISIIMVRVNRLIRRQLVSEAPSPDPELIKLLEFAFHCLERFNKTSTRSGENGLVVGKLKIYSP